MSKSKYSLPDALWEKIQPWIPPRENPHPRKGGRKPKDDRTVFTAILFVLRTGYQWNALNDTGICASATAFDRFQKWAEAGFFHRLWEEGLLEYDATQGIDWSWLSMDGVMTKSPLGGEKKRAKSNRPWEARRQKELALRYKRDSSGNSH
jgi:transposase